MAAKDDLVTTLHPSSTLSMCIVCYEEFEGDSFLIPGHVHSICQACSKIYVQTQLAHQKFAIACPMCPMTVSTERLCLIAGPEVLSMALTLRDASLDSIHCRSPACVSQNHRLTIDHGTRDFGAQGVAVLKCTSCQASYCYFCREDISDCPYPSKGVWSRLMCGQRKLHVCADREARHLAFFALQFDNHTKPCPQCLTLVHRAEGCRNMSCRCNAKYCWDCLALTNGQAHMCLFPNGPPPRTMRHRIKYIGAKSCYVAKQTAKLLCAVVQVTVCAPLCFLAKVFTFPVRFWVERKRRQTWAKHRAALSKTQYVVNSGVDVFVDTRELQQRLASACQGRWQGDCFVAWNLAMLPVGSIVARVHAHGQGDLCGADGPASGYLQVSLRAQDLADEGLDDLKRVVNEAVQGEWARVIGVEGA